MFRIFGVSGLLICAAAAQTQSPCALLTKADIQEAAGITVSDGAPNQINKSICEYKAGSTGSLINFSVTPKGPADTPEKVVAEYAKRKVPAQAVSGIADGAYWSSPGYGMQQMGAYKGNRRVIVTVLILGSPETKSKTIAEKVLRKAVSKL